MTTENHDNNQESTALMIPEDAAVKIVAPDQLPDLDSMSEGMSLAPSYREFHEGEPVRAVFCGFSEMQSQNRSGTAETDEPKMIPLGIFQSSDGVWVHAGANLVQQIKNVPIGTPLQITYKGKEKTKSGNNVAVFDVRLLKASEDSPEPRVSAPPVQPKPATGAQPAGPKPSTPPVSSELAAIANKVRVLAAGKGIPNLDAFIKTVLNKEVPTMATVEEATTVLDQLKAL